MRARNIKPAFFINEDLVSLPVEDRLLFIGLWCLADREGRLEDRPSRIGMAIFPADSFDVELMLGRLNAKCLISRYEHPDTKQRYIAIPKFRVHQNPHPNESASLIPAASHQGVKDFIPRSEVLPVMKLTPQAESGILNPEAKQKKRPRVVRSFTIADLLAVVAKSCGGQVLTEPFLTNLTKPLWAVIDALLVQKLGLEDVRLACEWLAAGGEPWPPNKDLRWLAKAGALLSAIGHAKQWQCNGRPAVHGTTSYHDPLLVAARDAGMTLDTYKRMLEKERTATEVA